MKNKKQILFVIYCLILVWIILFKLSFSLEEIRALRGVSEINLIPFHYDMETSSHFKEVVLNILIFVPFGLFTKMMDYNWGKSMIAGMGFSFVMEAGQYIFRLGSTDITDLITNTLGTIAGVILYALLLRIFRNREKVDRILIVVSFIGIVLFVCLALVLMIAN